MSVHVYDVEGWDGPTPIGTCSNRRLRWEPTWAAAWTDEERERFVVFLRANPSAAVSHDQGKQLASWLLDYFDRDAVDPAYTEADAAAALRLHGWLP
jgi:hypothetical protein